MLYCLSCSYCVLMTARVAGVFRSILHGQQVAAGLQGPCADRAIGDRREPLVQVVGLVPSSRRRVPQRTACSLCAPRQKSRLFANKVSRAPMLRRSA